MGRLLKIGIAGSLLLAGALAQAMPLGVRTAMMGRAAARQATPVALTLEGAIDAPSQAMTTGGDADWEPVDDATAVGGHSARSGAIAPEESTWMEMSVSGAGTLSFSWKADCEKDPRNRYSYDFGAFSADGIVKSHIDGTTAWQTVTVEITEGGAHTFRWTYSKDDYDEDDYAGEDCIWVDNVVWSSSSVPDVPSVSGDAGATVVGDAVNGYVVRPSEGNTAVEIVVPQGVDAAKVTVEVSTAVNTVKANGAAIRIVKGGNDITAYIDMPAANAGGVIDMTKATVKQSIADESFDASKGADIQLGDPSAPSLTTAPTKAGLTYTLREGRTLNAMSDGATKQGDGKPWTPAITVKGGTSGFYRIKVDK